MSLGGKSVFRSSVNKAEQDLPVRQKSNSSEGCTSAVKREKVVSKVVGLKQARKHRSDSKPSDREMSVDVSIKQSNKGLVGFWIKAKVMLAAMKMKQQQRRNQKRTRVLNTTSETVSKCEIPVHKLLPVDLI